MRIVGTAGEYRLIGADREYDAGLCRGLCWGNGFPMLLNIANVPEACFPTSATTREQCCTIVDFGLSSRDTGIHCCHCLLVGFIDNGHPWLTGGDDAFFDIRKKGTKGVEVTRRNRVELVVVALSASSRLTEPDGADGAHTIR